MSISWNRRLIAPCLFVSTFYLWSLASRPTPAAPASQPNDLALVLRGSRYPLTIKASSLNSSWRKFDVSKKDASLLSKALSRGKGDSRTPIYYTRGEVVRLGKQEYLIAYHDKVPATLDNLDGDSSLNDQLLSKLNRQVILHIALLNLEDVGSVEGLSVFNPARDFLPAKLSQPEPIRLSVRNLRSVGLALKQYTQDYDELLPPMKSAPSVAAMKSHLPQNSGYVQRSLWDYCKSYQIFIHPQSNKLYTPNLKLGGTNETSYLTPSVIVCFYEPVPATDGLRAVYS